MYNRQSSIHIAINVNMSYRDSLTPYLYTIFGVNLFVHSIQPIFMGVVMIPWHDVNDDDRRQNVFPRGSTSILLI